MTVLLQTIATTERVCVSGEDGAWPERSCYPLHALEVLKRSNDRFANTRMHLLTRGTRTLTNRGCDPAKSEETSSSSGPACGYAEAGAN